jgi:very-short-patch-repair endonuclease
MNFEQAHQLWLADHLMRRTGERKGRLERGHRHGERLFLKNVWWPVMRNLEHLHPEYEVKDWRRKSYFIDFAWLPGHIKVAFEIKGYGPHVRDMDRIRYCEELNREIYLQSMGFRVVSFAFDDVEKHPELCAALLRMFLSRYQPQPVTALDKFRHHYAKQILLLAFQLAGPVRPADVRKHLKVNFRTAVRYLQLLCREGWLRPIYSRSGDRVVKYELVRDNLIDAGWW